ncbi:MAG: DUF4998 domain-containing protein [Prevotellaceae bacterium]|jgi:hypothetical protein|nr:DUF4998 domain-containing protein [Prevotellaceae bacterium]
MKVIIKYFLTLSLLTYIAGCDDNNYMHQKYLDQGETLYMGKADSVKFSAGNERVKFTWILNADPRIDRCVFYWNDGKDSAVVRTNRSQSGMLNMEAILDVEEGIYTFRLVTKDDNNNMSLAVERTVQVYGPTYISRLVNRNMSSSFANDKLTINWVIIESALIQYSTVYYTDYSEPGNPVAKSVRVENSDTKTEISGIREGDTFSITTSYMPEGGLDILESSALEYTIK